MPGTVKLICIFWSNSFKYFHQNFLSMKGLFDAGENNLTKERINRLTPIFQPLWGKMTVSKMLAHSTACYSGYGLSLGQWSFGH